MKTCPFCAEEIQDAAIVCKHCGRELAPAKRPRAKDHPSYWSFTALSILLPVVGFIVGIVYLCKAPPLDKKLGEHTLALSILFSVIFAVLLGASTIFS